MGYELVPAYLAADPGGQATLAATGCYDLRAKGILSQAQAESRTITDLIKVAETYALLAVAEALQFSLVKIARAGPLLTPVPSPVQPSAYAHSSQYRCAVEDRPVARNVRRQ